MVTGSHIVLAGGGTAGHVNPALAVAEALVAAGARVSFLGTTEGLEADLVPARGFALATIPRVPLPRRPTSELLGVPGRLAGAIKTAAAHLDGVDAGALVGFGGYVSMPGYLAARRRHVPVVVHEANARPGLANRVGSRFAARVAVSYPNVRLPHAELVGTPLRRAVTTLDRLAERPAARAGFGLLAEAPTVLVTGGSQGARHINEVVLAAAPALLAAGVQVLHHAGRGNADAVAAAAPVPADGQPPYVVTPYLDRMEAAYAAADLVICRAGAMTCAELAAVGLPAIYVPLPHGNGEQRLNAEPVVSAGGGLLVADRDFDADWLARTALSLLSGPERLDRMARAAAAHGYRDADTAIARMVLDSLRAGAGT